MKITITEINDGVVGVTYDVLVDGVESRHWDFVKKILKLVDEENEDAIKQA